MLRRPKLNEYYETISTDCMNTATNVELSKESRAEELAVMAEARKIVKDSVDGAVSKVYSFLQVQVSSKAQSHMYLANLEVVNAVKKLARDHHSSALTLVCTYTDHLCCRALRRFQQRRCLCQDQGTDLRHARSAPEGGRRSSISKAYCDEEKVILQREMRRNCDSSHPRSLKVTLRSEMSCVTLLGS